MRSVLLVAMLVACTAKDRPSEAAREELAAFLLAIDHEPDTLWDRFAGRLVLRGDLTARDAVPEYYGVIGVDASELTYEGEHLDGAGGLRLKLVELNRRLATAPAASRERISLAIAPEVPWRTVVDVMDAAAAAGRFQVQLVFDRPPKTPAPPPTWVEAELQAAREHLADRRDGQALASVLARLWKKVLRDCDQLRTAMAIDSRDPDPAGAALARFAAALRKADCSFDLPALRSVVWLTVGNPYPHGGITIQVSDDGQPLALPAEMPWRDANAKLTRGMPPLRPTIRSPR